MPELPTLRVAIVGCGTHGAQCAALLENARLVVTCDRDPRRAAALAAQAHACFATNDLAEALSFLPDAVIIATPPKHLHLIALESIQAGSHLFLHLSQDPKPADLDAVLVLAQRARRTVMMKTMELAPVMAAFLMRVREFVAR